MNRMAWRMKFPLKLDQVPTKYPQGSPAGDRGQPSPVMSTELAAGRCDGGGSAVTGGDGCNASRAFTDTREGGEAERERTSVVAVSS